MKKVFSAKLYPLVNTLFTYRIVSIPTKTEFKTNEILRLLTIRVFINGHIWVEKQDFIHFLVALLFLIPLNFGYG